MDYAVVAAGVGGERILPPTQRENYARPLKNQHETQNDKIGKSVISHGKVHGSK
jgi:hypothetical protein